MMATRYGFAALALALLAQDAAAQAKAPAKPAPADDPAVVEDEPAEASPTVPVPASPTPAPPAMVKQDLSGHDLGGRTSNVFERDLFYADKADSEQTAKGTLVQGSLSSTTFGYHESGGTLVPPIDGGLPVPSYSSYDRLFTELRLQTDLRHISAGRWNARIDARVRVVGDPTSPIEGQLAGVPSDNSTIQSGLLGKNEYDIRELWLVRNGPRSDVYVGRQFIQDLGGVKIDGLRVDYAKSEKLTLLGFAGLYPIRGSRSVTDDYSTLYTEPDATGGRATAGRFTGAGGFGGAYRTANTYGAVGGVVIAPLTSAEDPRVYLTSTGYWRFGSKLDFYHLAIVDVVGSNAVNTGLTNLSLGLNWKPDQRLRGTLAFHRVDTETLNTQAQAFLDSPDRTFLGLQNEAYVARIATNQARASLSAGLGKLQRVELTAAVAFRYRGDVNLQTQATTPVTVTLPGASSIEIYGSVVDRRSVGHFRLGLDASQIIGVGDNTYYRTTSTQVRVSASHELGSRGEVELEAAYNHNADDGVGVTCAADLLTCAGAARSNVLSAGGTLFARLGRNWYTNLSVFVNHIAITHVDAGMTAGTTVSVDDPAVLGLTGFFRLAYRF